MLALKHLPTEYSQVTVNAGTQMRTGIAAAIESWGNGGSLQFQLMDGWKSAGAVFEHLGPLK